MENFTQKPLVIDIQASCRQAEVDKRRPFNFRYIIHASDYMQAAADNGGR